MGALPSPASTPPAEPVTAILLGAHLVSLGIQRATGALPTAAFNRAYEGLARQIIGDVAYDAGERPIVPIAYAVEVRP